MFLSREKVSVANDSNILHIIYRSIFAMCVVVIWELALA
jgi:hypothetical protein